MKSLALVPKGAGGGADVGAPPRRSSSPADDEGGGTLGPMSRPKRSMRAPPPDEVGRA